MVRILNSDNPSELFRGVQRMSLVNPNEMVFAGSFLGNNDAARLLAVSIKEKPHSSLRRASAFHGMKGGSGDIVDVPGDEVDIENK